MMARWMEVALVEVRAARIMSTYSLSSVFQPRSVAVIGGSPRERSLGRAVIANLRAGGFAGPVGVVNPRHARIEGIDTVASLHDLPWQPELVVIATPPSMVMRFAREAVACGVRALVVLGGGMGQMGQGPGSLAQELADYARRHSLRIVGPGSLGVPVSYTHLTLPTN